MKVLNALGFCLCFSACTNREAVPSNIIQPDSMQVVLRDVIMADQFATQFLLKDSLLKDSAHRNVKLETLQLYETIFKLHGVTKEEFRRSLDFYESRPDLSRNIFDSLSVEENRHRSEIYRPKFETPPHPKDSSASHAKDSLKLHSGNPLK
jgi:hypothetical protein